MKRSMTPVLGIQRSADLYPDKTAVHCGADHLTYAALLRRIGRLGWALRNRLGFHQGDRVAFLSPNCHRLLEAYFAVPWIQGVLLPLNVRLSREEMAFILSDAGTHVLFVHSEFKALAWYLKANVPSLNTIIWLDAIPETSTDRSYEDLLVLESSSPPLLPWIGDEEDVAELFYTSGTTGQPKGVMLTHRNLYCLALQIAAQLSLTDEDVFLHSLPMYHANGWGAPHTVTLVGGTHVIIPYPRPDAVADAVRRYRVTLAYMVPTMAIQLIASAPPETGMKSLTRLVIGGSAPAPSLAKEVWDAWGCTLIGAYGLTEHSPVASFAQIPSHWSLSEGDRYQWATKAGAPMVGVQARVVDDDGQDQARDGVSQGELWLRSDTVMKGYWGRPGETADVLTPDGWLRTGDVAVITPEGFIDIVDRRKDVIVSGGENISSIEVEAILYDHPAVLECAVVAVPDARWGERPHAFVVLKKGATANAGELREWCRAHLAHFKAPDVVDVIPELPKTGTGKIQKAAFRAPFWHGYQKRVN